MGILHVNGLCKSYPSFSLGPVSFELAQGKITGFIGRNGAGKTTTLKSIMNYLHPTAGSVCFFNQNRGLSDIDKQRIGFALGGVQYYPKKKLSSITKVTSSFYSNWDSSVYSKYMQLFNLDDTKTPSELSEGMKVKYSLAVALSHNANLLILDEPTSGLDPVSRDEIIEIFFDLCDKGISILFSTHITSDLEKCADNILYIKNGVIVADEKLLDFTNSYRIVNLSTEQEQHIKSPYLIGAKRAKNGYTALVKTQDAEKIPVETSEADLETIMVHMEKE